MSSCPLICRVYKTKQEEANYRRTNQLVVSPTTAGHDGEDRGEVTGLSVDLCKGMNGIELDERCSNQFESTIH